MLLLGVGASLPPLPRLTIAGRGTVSGISSGADFASQVLVALSDRFFGAGAFAGQAYGCAVTRFPGEPLQSCAGQPPTQQGPGCVGLASTGAAPCAGCPPHATVEYDHCKRNASWIDVESLRKGAMAAAASGAIPPLDNLRGARVYTYRGTRDAVYLPGSVNATGAFFLPWLADASQLLFEASIPSTHSQPSVDPHVPPSTCGVGSANGLQNCGYDGVGAMLQHFYEGALAPPPAGATGDPRRLLNFSQDLYGNASAQFAGLASYGLAYIPAACSGGAACRVHVALHGCGQSAVLPFINTTYALWSGYAAWGDANNVVTLFPQGGGFRERGWATTAAQVMAGCHDGYGQTGPLFAARGGAVMLAISAMLDALGGPGWWES